MMALLRIVEIESGNISIDGVDVRQVLFFSLYL
jgi:ABC-type multidrug transport system fused ATPase/permease subunit